MSSMSLLLIHNNICPGTSNTKTMGFPFDKIYDSGHVWLILIFGHIISYLLLLILLEGKVVF